MKPTATVIQGDCLEGLKGLDDELFDLVLIDAPYFDYKTGHRKDKGGKLSQSLVQQSREDQIEVVRECIKKLKTGCAFYYFTNWQEAWWFQEKFQRAGFLHNMIIWDKGNWTAGDLEGSFGNKYEVIFLGTKGSGWKYRGTRINDIDGWDIPRVGTNRVHSTEKPIALYKRIIEISCDEGAFILDPYGGSGSSAIAALELNRNIMVYEIDKDYKEGIDRRIETWQQEHTNSK